MTVEIEEHFDDSNRWSSELILVSSFFLVVLDGWEGRIETKVLPVHNVCLYTDHGCVFDACLVKHQDHQLSKLV